MAFPYTGFKLNEKKTLKELEEKHYTLALKNLQDKLGADWKLTIDWETFEKLTNDSTGTKAASKSARGNLPYAIYQNYIAKFGGEEVPKYFSSDLVEALNDAVKGKTFLFTAQDDSAPNGKFVLKVTDDAVVVSINLENSSYGYDTMGDRSIHKNLEKTL